MTKKTFYFTAILLCCFPLLVSATQVNNVAKVIILKGRVKAKIGSKIVTLKRGMWVPEKAFIQTAPRSFCKLLFSDKSQMSLGPNSKMEIKTFPQSRPGIINLLSGQLRSKVTKNYMDMKKKNRSKLFIRTKTAAMGVRGTDFQVNFNPQNMVTSLITFEGAVAMAKLDDTINRINQRVLEQVVSSKDAVIVTKGQYSGVDQAAPRVTPPTKINPNQLETLKKSTDSIKQLGATTSLHSPKKQFRSPIPPGLNAKVAANKVAVEKNIVAAVGKTLVNQVKQEMAKTDKPEAKWATKQLAQKTASPAPQAGGFVDLKTALYIPPPKGSTFDANTGVFVPPPQLGSIDPKTGDYIPPAGLKLTASGKFEVGPHRGPASIAPHTPPPSIAVALPSNQLNTDTSEINISENTLSSTVTTDNVVTADQEMIDDAVLDSTWDYENAPPPIEADGYTQVHIQIQ